MLIIKAKGGLGNRILSAATAIAYAKATGRDWCVDWSDGLYAPNGTNAINLLFSGFANHTANTADLTDRIVSPSLWRGRIRLSVSEIVSSDYPDQHSNPLLYRKISTPFSKKIPVDELEIFWSYTSKYGRIKRYLPIQQWQKGRDLVLGEVLTNYFKPYPHVLDSVSSLIGDKSEKTLGVHLRYTDLKVPIDKVINKVRRQLEKFEYEFIYLATDSSEAENKFKTHFDNVITQEKYYADNNKQLHLIGYDNETLINANAALVDMYALAACKGLVYCSRSTFGETSKLIGDFNKARLVDVDCFDLTVRVKRFLQEYL